MSSPFDQFGINAGFVEEQFNRYLENPQLVHESWRGYFDEISGAKKGLGRLGSNGNGHAASSDATATSQSSGAVQTGPIVNTEGLIWAYRTAGHLAAQINPLESVAPAKPSRLNPARYGAGDLSRTTVTDLPWLPKATVGELVNALEKVYCRTIGVEIGSIDDEEEREWLALRLESSGNKRPFTAEQRLSILTKLTQAEALEQFIHNMFKGAKRFSVEGGESLIPLLDFMVDDAGAMGVEEIVFGMAHRGRLNVLVNLLGKGVRELFSAFQDSKPELYMGSGDVKYHLGFSSDRETSSGNKVHLTLAFNPSHLEWVNPVVEGRARAKQDQRSDKERTRVLPILIHGDAAFMGQGVVTETLNLMGLEGYTTGGTLHIVVNNQVGFTTDPRDSRSTRYATDIARFLGVPVFHVNGDDPEALVHVGQVALEYRQRFGKDVIIDLVCFRKYGHNEGDEPRFTQPTMYAIIDSRPSVREVYASRLASEKAIDNDEAKKIWDRERDALGRAYNEAKNGDFHAKPNTLGGLWSGYRGGADKETPEVATAVDATRLRTLLAKVTEWPEGFTPHPKIANVVLGDRKKAREEGAKLDWGTAETLAYASLLEEGVTIRITGQDVRRGTFSHRHAFMRDNKNGEKYSPLTAIAAGKGRFEAFDSPLSEAAVLGFEYGYSLDTPSSLVVWEAQFGDFANTAQVIIDQFLVAAEDKWHRLSGLIMLLPHGYEGAGPEHSSARLERFLQSCAEDNIQVCNLTTPAQIFHALRRQVLRPWRKPLVVMSPKSLLRQKLSTIEDLATGRFHRAIGDATVAPSSVRKILLCSGKVYFDLLAEREARGAKDVAIVRLEQLYPLNDEVREVLASYASGTPLVWVQEEPWNMGAWYYIKARLPLVLGDRFPLSCVARVESASPATGSHNAHVIEQKLLVSQAFE